MVRLSVVIQRVTVAILRVCARFDAGKSTLTATNVKLLKQLEAYTNSVFEERVIKKKLPSDKWDQAKAAAITR